MYWLAGIYGKHAAYFVLCKADFRRRRVATDRKSKAADGKIGGTIDINTSEPVH